MEVEDADAKAHKKALIYALGSFLVVAIGLIIAIVILSNLKNQEVDSVYEVSGTYTDQSMDIYEAVATEILDRTTTSGNVNDLIATYRVYIEKATDGGAKALLFTAYYMILMSLDTNLSMKDEILNGLIAADDVIKNASSALAVSNAANYYQDQATFTKYQDIAKNRLEDSR